MLNQSPAISFIYFSLTAVYTNGGTESVAEEKALFCFLLLNSIVCFFVLLLLLLSTSFHLIQKHCTHLQIYLRQFSASTLSTVWQKEKQTHAIKHISLVFLSLSVPIYVCIMYMDKEYPYLFWLISGAILLLLHNNLSN